MDIKELAKDHIKNSYVMQLATSRDNKPWICNVHFLADDDLNMYWMSVPNCRHSEDLAANPLAAVAIAVHTEMPLIGVQIEGKVEQLEFADHEPLLHRYAARHNRADFVENALSGKAPFRLYRLTPTLISIFDLKNFPHSPKQEWQP
jgi:uncharacterized protein YhbP (UPF0306 family)